MDPILIVISLFVFAVIIPVLLPTITLTAYLWTIVLAISTWIIYSWLVETFAPSPSASRPQATYGLSQVYPTTGNPKPSENCVADESTTAYILKASCQGQILDCNTDIKWMPSIIFVHGLGANPETMWTAIEKEATCCWITDLLPADLENAGLNCRAKLYMLKYNSLWIRNSNMKLRDTALSLLQDITQIKGRITLVGHGYGGIVIKQTLNMSAEYLQSRVKGMVFLGTPHQGTSFNRYGILASYLLAPLDPDIEIMRILAPDSFVLDGLKRDFERLYTNTPRKYFYENQKTQFKVFGFLTLAREFVVLKQSATHGSYEMDTVMLETDHRVLNKFPGRNSNYNLVARELLSLLPKSYSIPALEFACLDLERGDADYPERSYYGYPDGARLDPEYAVRATRPVGDSIITCRRTSNALLRYRMSGLVAGVYHVIWLFWMVGGRNFSTADQARPVGFFPPAEPDNSVCERVFPSTVAAQGPSRTYSSFFYPWELHCSVGRPQHHERFLHADIDSRPEVGHPLAAPVLLRPGFKDKCLEPGYWRTMKNTGWYEVKGQLFEVGEDGEIAFVIGNKFRPRFIGGFSSGGLRLEQIA